MAEKLANLLPSSASLMQPESGTPKLMRLPEKTVNELWRRMAEIYGHRWTSQYGETDTDGTWARGLVGITGAELAAGLQRCVRIGAARAQTCDEDWPPTVGEFRGYCLPEKPRYVGTDYVKLPKPEIPEDERTKIRQELYSAIGRQAPDQPPKLEDVK